MKKKMSKYLNWNSQAIQFVCDIARVVDENGSFFIYFFCFYFYFMLDSMIISFYALFFVVLIFVHFYIARLSIIRPRSAVLWTFFHSFHFYYNFFFVSLSSNSSHCFAIAKVSCRAYLLLFSFSLDFFISFFVFLSIFIWSCEITNERIARNQNTFAKNIRNKRSYWILNHFIELFQGLPLHVQIDTFEDPRDVNVFHRGYCQIKVFCDKVSQSTDLIILIWIRTLARKSTHKIEEKKNWTLNLNPMFTDVNSAICCGQKYIVFVDFFFLFITSVTHLNLKMNVFDSFGWLDLFVLHIINSELFQIPAINSTFFSVRPFDKKVKRTGGERKRKRERE